MPGNGRAPCEAASVCAGAGSCPTVSSEVDSCCAGVVMVGSAGVEADPGNGVLAGAGAVISAGTVAVAGGDSLSVGRAAGIAAADAPAGPGWEEKLLS